MRILDPLGLIHATASFASAHDYAPATVFALLLVLLAHVLVLLAVVGAATRALGRARERRAVITLLTPVRAPAGLPAQRRRGGLDQSTQPRLTSRQPAAPSTTDGQHRLADQPERL